jgi:membrane-bound lytic murein transglycosylase A
MKLEPIGFEDLPVWPPLELEEALSAFRKSCEKLPDGPVVAGDKTISPQAWERACRKTDFVGLQDNPMGFFTSAFQPYAAVTQGRDSGLLTGYYEPLLYGSLTPDERFKYPVWGVPKDLASPYLTHREIDENGLEGRAETLLYVDDPVDLFFLHIQGSGNVQLPDGGTVQLGYAGKNGHPYTAIGRILIDRGEIPAEEMTAQRLKAWLRDHPGKAKEIMWQNESYVFFTLRDTEEHAIGAEGVPLTPEASIAVDPSHVPYGTPVYVDTTLPNPPLLSGDPSTGQVEVCSGGEDKATEDEASTYQRLLVAQDTGGAIRGPLRGDLFFGPGERAEALAGAMKQSAKFYLLLPKAQ